VTPTENSPNRDCIVEDHLRAGESLCYRPGVPILWGKPLPIIFHQHFLHWKHFKVTFSLITMYSVFGAKQGNLFCFGAIAQLKNTLPFGWTQKRSRVRCVLLSYPLTSRLGSGKNNKQDRALVPLQGHSSYLNSCGTWCSHTAPTWDQKALEWVTITLAHASLLPCAAWSYLTARMMTKFFFAKGKQLKCY